MYSPYDPSHYPLVEAILKDFTPATSPAMTREELRNLLQVLQDTLNKGIEGAVLELGCFMGHTSVSIRKLLDLNASNKDFHVYDSFEGLPPLASDDLIESDDGFYEGLFSCSPKQLIHAFKEQQLKLPQIHQGFFTDLPDAEFPQKIAFAFFDGDLYESIYVSLQKVYPKLMPQGAIVIDDWIYYKTPGVPKACKSYFRHKLDYAQGMYPGSNQAFIVKGEKSQILRPGWLRKWSQWVEKLF